MTAQTPAPQPSEKRSWFARHKFMSGLGALILAVIVINAVNGGSDATTPNTGGSSTAASETTTTSNDGVTDTADDTTTQPTEAPAKPKALKSAAPKVHVVHVKAEKMIHAFENNEAAADLKYKGKTVEVTGVVTKVDTELFDDTQYAIDLNGGGQWQILTVTCNDVSQAVAAKVAKGSTVSVIGQFDDGGDLGETLKDCTVAH